jgi:hypothetical protein
MAASHLRLNALLCNLPRPLRFWQTRSHSDRPSAIPDCEENCTMPTNNAASLSPDERVQQIARLLAAGVRRLFTPRIGDVPDTPNAPEKSPESAETGLEVSQEMRLSAHTG